MFESEKHLCLGYFDALDAAPVDGIANVLMAYLATDCRFYGVHPFDEISGPTHVAEQVWQPLYSSFTALQRRQDIFFAGIGDVDGNVWVMSMGHLMGLFDRNWLGIPATRRVGMLRYAEFMQVENKKIQQVGFFLDILDVMRQAGVFPLPPETGVSFTVPGPRTHDGIILDSREPEEGRKTLELTNAMVEDLVQLNQSGNDRCSQEYLAKRWAEDMIWYGPCGIGSTYTIERYQAQHQFPFREGLADKTFNNHVARIAEGNYAGWYGWPNLSNTPKGGFLGLPAGPRSDMRVVDVYRREGDKLVENWVLIDLLWWLKQQGLSVLERLEQL